MAVFSSKAKITSITKALECCEGLVRPEKWTVAQTAFYYLQQFADEMKDKEPQKFLDVTRDSRKRTYHDISKKEKEAGGVLFEVLDTLKKAYDISDIWENYYLLIKVYMRRKEYKEGFILHLFEPSSGKGDETASSRKYKGDKGGKRSEKSSLDPIKYILTLAEYSDRINESLKKDLEHAREEYKLLRTSEEELRTKHFKQFQHICHKHSEMKDQEQKTKESEVKEAKKLHEVLMYMRNTATQGANKEQAILALRDYFKLVEIHHANLKPAKTEDVQQLDLTTLHKSRILPRLLELVREDSDLYTQAKKRLEELVQRDDEVKQYTTLRIRKNRWEELSEGMKIQSLIEEEEVAKSAKTISDDVHKVIFKVKDEIEDGYNRALLCLASLLYSENLCVGQVLQVPTATSRPPSSLSERLGQEMSLSPTHSSSGDQKYQNRIDILESEVEFQRNQIEDLTTRLSKFATQQLTQGNPNIADLSDRNRPTNIGDKFGQVFDEEWSEAYNAVKKCSASDEDIMQTLSSLIQKCYSFCQDVAADQQKRLEEQLQIVLLSPMVTVSTKSVAKPKGLSVGADALSTITEKYAREYRKAAGACSVESITKLYRDQKLTTDIPKVKDSKDIETVGAYTDKLIECTWYMVIQDPPMVLHFIQPGEKINLQHYQYHEKKGTTAEMCVWPALFLYQGGPVVKKGYVLPQ